MWKLLSQTILHKGNSFEIPFDIGTSKTLIIGWVWNNHASDDFSDSWPDIENFCRYMCLQCTLICISRWSFGWTWFKFFMKSWLAARCFSDILKVGWWVLLCFGRIFCHQEGDKKSYTFMTLQVSGAKVMHCGKLSNKAKVARGGEYSIILGRISCHQQCMGDQFGWQIVYENDNHPIRPKVVMSSHYFYFPLYSLNS